MLALAAAGILLAAANSPAAVPTIALPSDPCDATPRCREFATADVTGDGIVDRIGYRLIGYDADRPFGPVVLRVVVTSADGKRFAFDSRHRLILGGVYGAAPIDGVPGAEIAVSWQRGAHADGIEVITFRDGGLVREKGWVRDSAATYGVGVEWIPGVSPTSPIMRRCAYDDVPVGGKPSTRTTTVDFTWQEDRWVRGPAATADYSLDRPLPWQCMRFQVPGLSKFPMRIPG